VSHRVADLIRLLELVPHPEGGHFSEVYRSSESVRQPDRERSAVTTIYYLLAAGEISRWHVVASDEVWHFYEGDGLDLVTYDPSSGRVARVELNRPSASAAAVQVVPAGHWQAARPRGAYALAGCTVAPGFEYEDFQFVADVPGHEAAFAGPLRAYRDML